MSDDRVARVVAPRRQLERMVSLAVLRPDGGDPFFDELYLRFDESTVETPAGDATAAVSAYCSADAAALETVTVAAEDRVRAVVDVGELLDWLAWIAAPEEPVTLRFEGDRATGFVSRIGMESGRLTTRVDCYSGGDVAGRITRDLSHEFDDAERYRVEGRRLPTVVETDAAELLTVVEAVQNAPGGDDVPFVVEDGELRVSVGGRARGTLDAELVDGPDVYNEYAGGFEPVFGTLSGRVTLQTGPDAPLAVVQVRDDHTLRYVLPPVVR